MSILWKFLGIFMIIWLIWYFTGGPQRSSKVKPYVRYDYDQNVIYRSNTDLETGAKEMINVNPENVEGSLDALQDNFENPSFTEEEN